MGLYCSYISKSDDVVFEKSDFLLMETALLAGKITLSKCFPPLSNGVFSKILPFKTWLSVLSNFQL